MILDIIKLQKILIFIILIITTDITATAQVRHIIHDYRKEHN